MIWTREIAFSLLLAIPGSLAVEAEAPEEGLRLLDAIALTLENDPNVALTQSQVKSFEGAWLIAASRFDPDLTADVQHSQDEVAPPSVDASTLTTGLGLTGELRSGLDLESSVDLTRIDAAGDPVNTATVSFVIRQPLLRGRGQDVVTANEQAAERELEASRLDGEHRVAERLLAVASQYWRVRAAAEDLEVLRFTEDSSRELLGTTRRLIEADVTPAAEIIQLEADLVSREANRIAGERVLFQARQDLGREIGLPYEEIAVLPLPADVFPVLDAEEVSVGAAKRWIGEALERRADLRAAAERRSAAEQRFIAADDALRPRLDLVFNPSYSGRVDGGGAGDFLQPLTEIPGLSASLALSYGWPLRNRNATGALLQAEATVEQSVLAWELVARAIGADVPAALDAVRRNAEQLAKFEEAEGFFTKTLENEIKKLRAGSSTLVDVITQRDRLTAIQRQQVTARLALAVSILELRFETGTLFDVGAGAGSVNAESLTTLPF